MMNFDGWRKTGRDAEIEESLNAHLSKNGISAFDALKLFPVLARRQWLKRFLAHTDLFKMTLNIPGDIAELGVFRGVGLMTWANLLEAYCIGDRTKVVYGFDNWRGFREMTKEDGLPDETIGKMVGGYNPEKFSAELLYAMDIFDSDRFIPWKPRIMLVNGNIEDTVPKFIEDNPGVRFSLVHFDCDLYAPTKAALHAIWPRINRGGLLLFDEYGVKDWPGETLAVDEFMADKPELRLKTLEWTNTPAAYMVKP